MTYYRLRPGEGYLEGIDVGPEHAVKPKDVDEAEGWARQEIEETLGKAWDATDLALVPPTVQLVAHLLGAAFVLDIAHRNDPADHAGADYRKQAEDIMMKLRKGARGLRLADGSWDIDFPGNRNREEGRQGGVQIISG